MQPPIEFVLMVNKQGQTRLSRYFKPLVSSDKTLLEAELIRRCLGRGEDECNFLEIREHKVVYRRYASLYFIVGTRDTQDVVGSWLVTHRTSWACWSSFTSS
ncbi:MAG: uncharacterized protein KVP18_003388 [Porospora cf. gigantea A]|uniref:uncharacterized protein n=1 Tax=Porospora cf. gigantea A TaxID=2853593 RepID=UPI00355ABCB1|nr:MAG: hypothetical protein KVP18_003388 [Porospora cf. gigantea A]